MSPAVGLIVVRVSRNPDRLHDAIARLSKETGAPVWSVNSGFYETGETGVGSENIVTLKPPHILVVADEGVDQTSYGSLWWTSMLSRMPSHSSSVAPVRGSLQYVTS